LSNKKIYIRRFFKMPDGFNSNLIRDLAQHIGQTVTIFTTSGGQSGRGFTGVLASVNPNFVRLVTQIGSAPGCALGSCCDDRHHHRDCDCERDRDRDRFDCRGNNLGSIVDIPVDRIAAFVHNAVGSGGWY
jgi:hypothetical protein